MRQLKITKPIANEVISPEEEKKRKEIFQKIFCQSREEKLRDKEALRKDLSIYVSQFSERYCKFKPTENELSEIVDFCMKFIENNTENWFDRFFIFCMRGKIIYIYKKKNNYE